MRKKYYMLMLVSGLIIGTIFAALPPVKADPGPVRFYVMDAENAPPPRDHIVDPVPPNIPPIPNVFIHVYIESPYAWMDTPDGIVAYMVSVRVDPRFLTVFDIVAPGDYNGDMFSDGILEMYAALYGGSTLQAPAAKDTATGTLYGFGNALVNMPDPTIGAGGDAFYMDDEAMLCTITARVAMGMPAGSSLIDLMGPGVSTEQIVRGISVSCKYTTAAGDTFTVEPEDGYYTSEVDTMYLDSLATYDPAAPEGSLWHELAPIHCRDWSLDSWDDNGDLVLSESDQVDMTCLNTGFYAWYHVEWVNPTPVAGDGIADLIVKFKIEIPEFPLGVGLMLMLAPAIPILYLWRKSKRVV